MQPCSNRRSPLAGELPQIQSGFCLWGSDHSQAAQNGQQLADVDQNGRCVDLAECGNGGFFLGHDQWGQLIHHGDEFVAQHQREGGDARSTGGKRRLSRQGIAEGGANCSHQGMRSSYPGPQLVRSFKLLAPSVFPAASNKPVQIVLRRHAGRTSPPRLAVARTPPGVLVGQKSCSAVARQAAHRAHRRVCLAACQEWAMRWTGRCSKRHSRGGKSDSFGPQHPKLQRLFQASCQFASGGSRSGVIVRPNSAHNRGACVLGQHQFVQRSLRA